MKRPVRRRRWILLYISVLFTFLVGGLISYGSTTTSSGKIHSASSVAPPQWPNPDKHPWTAVASTGIVDESSLDIFAFGPPPLFGPFPFGSTYVGYEPASTSTNKILLRYNVVNTYDNNPNPNMPGWSTLELGSAAPAGSVVYATLFQVTPCNGLRTRICTTINQGAGVGVPQCTTCAFPETSGPIDFGNYLYYVELELGRAATTSNPKAFTLRIY